MTIKQQLRRLLRPATDGASAIHVRPLSEIFGYDRGTPIDRHYIDMFLGRHRHLVQGKVLEIASDEYTRKYGGSNAESIELHTQPTDRANAFVGDLTNPDSLPAGQIDCFICTQTFNFIYDVNAALRGAHHVLADGGYLLATVGGVSQISRYDMDRWGDYWRFTTASCQRMFEEQFQEVEVVTFGNVLAATAMLRGLAVEDLPSPDLLNDHDPNYQVVVGVVARKLR